MSKLFTKLDTAPAVKVWDDEAFEALYNDPKCYNFRQALGHKPETWKAWYSFLERNKLNVDHTAKEPHWLMWLYFEQFGGRSLAPLGLPPSIAKQFSEFKAFYEEKEAKEQKERDIAEAKRLEAWRWELRRRKAETDSQRIAWHWGSGEGAEGKTKSGAVPIEEVPFDTTSAQLELVWVWENKGKANQKLLDIRIECSNYGLTYSPEDMKAINEGRKRFKDCRPFVKEYPVPIITVDEERKRKYIDAYNLAKVKPMFPRVDFYARSDADLLKKAHEAAREQARRLLRKPGETRSRGPSAYMKESGQSLDLARKYLQRPSPRPGQEPQPPPLPPTAARESKVKNRPSTNEKAQS